MHTNNYSKSPRKLRAHGQIGHPGACFQKLVGVGVTIKVLVLFLPYSVINLGQFLCNKKNQIRSTCVSLF